MISSRHLSLSLIALSLAAIAIPAVSAAPGVQPIAAARQRALGTTVTVRGTVSVPSNAFDAGFAVEQQAAGIYVLDSGGVARALGDRVEITGTLVDSFGLLAIQPSTITALGSGPQLRPQPRATRSIGEASEGRLVELEGVMVGDLIDDSPFGFILSIDDGSGPVQLFLFPGTGISTTGLVEGVGLHVICFSGQFDTHYECNPRGPDDLEIVSAD